MCDSKGVEEGFDEDVHDNTWREERERISARLAAHIQLTEGEVPILTNRIGLLDYLDTPVCFSEAGRRTFEEDIQFRKL